VKEGSLVRRLSNWVNDNPWMASMTKSEIGIVTKSWAIGRNDKLVVVLWARSGLRTEHINDIENA
jgi:hypothetical protein